MSKRGPNDSNSVFSTLASRNATPKTLWESFVKRGTAKELKTALSTLKGKHGTAARKTEVPRKTLLDALKNEPDLADTEDLGLAANKEPCQRSRSKSNRLRRRHNFTQSHIATNRDRGARERVAYQERPEPRFMPYGPRTRRDLFNLIARAAKESLRRATGESNQKNGPRRGCAGSKPSGYTRRPIRGGKSSS